MSADYRVAAKAVKFEKPASALNNFINQGAFFIRPSRCNPKDGARNSRYTMFCVLVRDSALSDIALWRLIGDDFEIAGKPRGYLREA